MTENQSTLLVRYATSEGSIQDVDLFDVKWVETDYWQESESQEGSYVNYTIVRDDETRIKIPRSAIGIAYHRCREAEGNPSPTPYYDEAASLLDALSRLCTTIKEPQTSRKVDNSCFIPFARWAEEKHGIKIPVPWHSQEKVIQKTKKQ